MALLKTNKVKVNVPMTPKSLLKPSDWPLISQNIKNTLGKYGPFIKQAAKISNVPEEIINSVIYLESAGKADVVSHAGAVGLMQVTPDTATGVIHVEHKAGRLTEDEKKVLRKVLGKRLDCLLQMKYMNHKLPCAPKGQVVTRQDLLNPEFNILIGTMLFGSLIDQHTENGIVRLDKCIVRYNAGWFYKPQGKNVDETLAFAQQKGGKETYGYILKFVGKDGLLDNLTRA